MLYVHFSLYSSVLLYKSPEEHYCNVKHVCVGFFLAWVRLCDEGLDDLHLKADTPSERVSTSVRHVSAQEFRQCRETFPSPNK